MQIKRDWTITFDEEKISKTMGPSFDRLLRDPKRQQVWQTALQEARELVQPAAVWDTFAIREILHKKVVLANGLRLGGGPVTTVVGGASDLTVAVCTAGQPIGDRVSLYQQEKRLFEGMMLSDLGSWAVDSVRQQLCHLLDEEAAQNGLRTSTPLSPGESEWSVADQEVIFQLVDARQIGVSLTSQMVMYPLKSLSLIMGTGSQPMGLEDGDSCMFCAMKDRCSYRELRPHGAAQTA
jgi:hypothetical protein